MYATRDSTHAGKWNASAKSTFARLSPRGECVIVALIP
jgi:hypothetical protein